MDNKYLEKIAEIMKRDHMKKAGYAVEASALMGEFRRPMLLENYDKKDLLKKIKQAMAIFNNRGKV